MEKIYKRRMLCKEITYALRNVGGRASRSKIKLAIVNDDKNHISKLVLDEDNQSYNDFNIGFNMDIINLRTCGLIKEYKRNEDISLTEKGKNVDLTFFPSAEEKALMEQYWLDNSNDSTIKPKKTDSEKTVLNELQIKLAEQLLLSVLHKELYVTYSELAERVNPPIHHRNVGKNIGQISKLCHELGLPLLSAKVVSKSTSIAGEGFFALQQSLGIPADGRSEKELYDAERKAIRECTEWYRLEDYLGLKIGMPRPELHQLGEFHSWNLIQTDVAIIKGDKSFFEHNDSEIPKEIKWFFDCESLQPSQSKEVSYDYQGKQYAGRILNDPFDQCRIL